MNDMTLFFLATMMMLCTRCADSNIEYSDLQDPKRINVTDTLTFKSGIRSLFQDSKGNYWFGSDQEGVCRFDGKNFSYFNTENGFCGKQVIQIREDETGLVWFRTSSGICSFDGNRFFSLSKGYLTGTKENEQPDAWTLNDTDIWFPGMQSRELIRIAKGKHYTVAYPFEIPTKGNPVDYGITAFSISKNGGLWIAHYSGVNYYDGHTMEFINDSTLRYDGKSRYMHVRSILEDSKGRLWIGNNGIGVQLKVKNTIIHFSEKYHLFKGEAFGVKAPEGTLMHVFAIREDSAGNIWFGDRDTGVWRFDGKDIKNFMVDASLSTQHIWDIFEDRQGHLLIASADKGVYQFNGNGFERVF